MENSKKNKLAMVMIVVLFMSPIVLSWWFLNYTNVVTEGEKSNHGDLIIPPRQIINLDLVDPLEKEKDYKLHGKWSMVYVSDICERECLDNLYRMRQIHIAMDKHSLRVQRVLFLVKESQQDLESLFTDYKGQRFVKMNGLLILQLLDQFRLTQADDPVKAGRIYIIDPLGNLMMSFEPDSNPRGIMMDLKKLLKASRIG